MKILFLAVVLTAVTGFSTASHAGPKSPVLVVPDVLVKAYGGAFKGDIVADYKVDEGDLIRFIGLRLEAKHETFLLSGEGELRVDWMVCRYAAPRPWRYSYAFDAKKAPPEDAKAVFFFRNGIAGLSLMNRLSIFDVKSDVWCSKINMDYVKQ